MRRQARIREAAPSLRAGAPAVMPADTVCGLAAQPNPPDAVARHGPLKQRSAGDTIEILQPGTMYEDEARKAACTTV